MAFDLSKIKSLFKRDKKKEVEEVANIAVEDGAVSSDTFVKAELSQEDIDATNAAKEEIIKQQQKKKKITRKIIIVIVIVILAILIIRLIMGLQKKKKETAEIMKNVSQVRVMNISSEISGSGTLKPKIVILLHLLLKGM